MNEISSAKSLSGQLQRLQEIQDAIAEQAHKDRNPVIEVCQSLEQYIREFEGSLDVNHEVGAKLASFGQAVTFHIVQVGFSKPNIVTFYGETESGEKVQLIQHVSQLSVLLISIQRKKEEPKKPIGFIWK